MILLLECLPDETLVRQLGCVRRDCLHLSGKGRVCVRLQKTEQLLAMIDEDPGADQPPYLLELNLVSDEYGIRILHDEKRRHRVIVLRPRLEEWIIAATATARLTPRDFGLSDRGNELHKEINFRIRAFKRLIKALLAARSPGISRLKEALTAKLY